MFLNKMRLLSKLIVFVVPTALFAGPMEANPRQQQLINAEVAVQLKEDGLLTDEINHLRLSCLEGQCEIKTTVLNRCTSVGGDKFQSPFSFSEKSTNPNTSFKINGNEITASVESSDFGGNSVTTYYFVLDKTRFPHKITRFSGGYTKNSDITKSLIQVEFIPFKQEYQRLKLACPIELPGLVSGANK